MCFSADRRGVCHHPAPGILRLFERQAHEMIEKGASVDELSKPNMQNLKGQFGDSWMH